MKRILIFTAGFGEGHNTAARNIRDAIEHISPDEATVEILDLFETCYGRFNEFVKKAYLTAINKTPRVWGRIYDLLDNTQILESNLVALSRVKHAMEDVLRKVDPDTVVTTYPVYNYLFDEIYSTGRDKTFAHLTVVTDSITVNSIWFRASSDFYLVANDATADVLKRNNVPEERIRVFGFPVTHRFAELRGEVDRRPPPSKQQGRRVLYMLNSGKKEAPELVRELASMKHVQLTVTVGRDPDLMAKVEAAVKKSGAEVELHGWTQKIPELLARNHLLISKAGGATVQESIAARCPMIMSQVVPGQEEGNARLIIESEAGALAVTNKAIVQAVENAFESDAKVWRKWEENITRLSKPEAALEIARFVLETATPGNPPPRKLAPFEPPAITENRKHLLICDLHTHTTYSDGKLSVREIVDFYGQRGFDVLCITDHICDHNTAIGKMTNLTGLVLLRDQVAEYFEVIQKEAARAMRKYNMIVMTGLEFNKDGYTKKTSAHLLAVDLKGPIDPGLTILETIAEIHKQGALAIASHPHEFKTTWGKDTLFFWENIDTYAPLLDAWEVANRDDIFNPVGLKQLPFVGNSDFHKPKHIYSWKTMLCCEKEPEAIKQCIRANRDVALTLYRDHKIGIGFGEDPNYAAKDHLLYKALQFPLGSAPDSDIRQAG
jgi:processive 1,2-diacylglycerol beta-glucosyltransferase